MILFSLLIIIKFLHRGNTVVKYLVATDKQKLEVVIVMTENVKLRKHTKVKGVP